MNSTNSTNGINSDGQGPERVDPFSPVEQITIRNAVADRAADYFGGPLNLTQTDTARYLSEGPLAELTDKHGLRAVWEAVAAVIAEDDSVLTRSRAQRDRLRTERVARLDDLNETAASRAHEGNFDNALRLLDEIEAIDPSYRPGPRSIDDLRQRLQAMRDQAPAPEQRLITTSAGPPAVEPPTKPATVPTDRGDALPPIPGPLIQGRASVPQQAASGEPRDEPDGASWQVTRILVTGSRDWTDSTAIADALAVWRVPGTVLVHGNAMGADRIAAAIWKSWGLPVEPHPADWLTCVSECPPGHRRRRRDGVEYCPRAGDRRDDEMVAAGADVCLAFVHNISRGATRCADSADDAGIPTKRYLSTSHAATNRTELGYTRRVCADCGTAWPCPGYVEVRDEAERLYFDPHRVVLLTEPVPYAAELDEPTHPDRAPAGAVESHDGFSAVERATAQYALTEARRWVTSADDAARAGRTVDPELRALVTNDLQQATRDAYDRQVLTDAEIEQLSGLSRTDLRAEPAEYGDDNETTTDANHVSTPAKPSLEQSATSTNGETTSGPAEGPSDEELARVLAHIRARSISHPETGATGMSSMPDEWWLRCVAQLRRAGHEITEGTVAPADSATNATGYFLREMSANDACEDGRCFEIDCSLEPPHFATRAEAEAWQALDWDPGGNFNGTSPYDGPIRHLDQPCVSISCECGDLTLGKAKSPGWWKSAEHHPDRSTALAAALADGYAVDTIIEPAVPDRGRSRDERPDQQAQHEHDHDQPERASLDQDPARDEDDPGRDYHDRLMFSRDDPRTELDGPFHLDCSSAQHIETTDYPTRPTQQPAREPANEAVEDRSDTARLVAATTRGTEAAAQRLRGFDGPAVRDPDTANRIQVEEFARKSADEDAWASPAGTDQGELLDRWTKTDEAEVEAKVSEESPFRPASDVDGSIQCAEQAVARCKDRSTPAVTSQRTDDDGNEWIRDREDTHRHAVDDADDAARDGDVVLTADRDPF